MVATVTTDDVVDMVTTGDVVAMVTTGDVVATVTTGDVVAMVTFDSLCVAILRHVINTRRWIWLWRVCKSSGKS